jgi:broad specificity phosphatase PhoE
MKWPKYLCLIRHDISEYNILKDKKSQDETYQEFLREYNIDSTTDKCVELAKKMAKKFALGVSDHDTMLQDIEAKRSEEVGVKLREMYNGELPDVVFVSPYKRTKNTLEGLIKGWPELKDVKIYEDERIREQEHGLASLYNDWKVFFTIYPDQRRLHDQDDIYWYRYPQGENVPDVRDRNRSWLNTMVRDFADKKVLVVTHHLNILAMRANLERWSAAKFIETDKNDKPINCGVTMYRGDPEKGKDGHLELEYYNNKYYTK